ncbi:DEAD/DEAH box helicase [Waterburya agarophytonicola K14]|uniref:DEAD/DEAH box helicase n=1 Tax=Waterburya agarophytonicola KI4 TaxID=2874699 RepID=A0A964FFS7_9CYAN|nr:DEAD/DEAH box helicase [Waterburya agarophytonicola]MCC0175768.1 DEAD/DEAH box helicase [Waterburya agarophytonicola KI4]
MSIIHGSWIVNSGQNYFFIWGETWRSLVNEKFSLNKSGDFIHPFDLSQQELLDLCQSHQLDILDLLNQSTWQTQLVGMPTIVTGTEDSKKIQPVFAGDIVESEASLDLYLWEVKGFRLTPQQTVELLQVLSFSSLQSSVQYLAGDICFWSHIYRWVLDLIVRQKFLPGIDESGSRKTPPKSIWQPIIDSEVDRVRLAKFIQTIPEACLAYLDAEKSQANTTDEELLLRSLSIMLDSRLRTWIDYQPNGVKDSIVQPWLQSLAQSPKIEGNNQSIKRLSNALYNWTLPISEYIVDPHNNNLGQNRYRVCFVLTPPAETTDDTIQNDWSLNYYLQALDDSNFVINAGVVWQCAKEFLNIGDRTIENPQETLLKGLGLATRIYSPIADSLEKSQPISCVLNPIQVYEFIRAIAWQLKDNGLGVILPPGLTQGNSEQRLGIKMTASVNQRKGERLSLQSMLKYKLEIAVGDRSVSKRDFKKLLAQKSPIVEIDGQWIALQPADVRAAQAVLDKSNEQLDLSVEDALRLSTGDTKTLAKLPVVKFETTGVLSGLLDNLSDNKAVEAVNNIKGFKGELRPYQAKGVGWLSFLETWGLGACLADDMGLGKTIQLIGFILNLKQQKLLTKPTLLVCPTSVINNWEREVKKFAPTLKTVIHHGDKREQGKTFSKQVKDCQLVITSYSLVHRDLKTLSGIQWQGVVLDEAQNIKNPSAKQSQAVRDVPAGFRIALTGTPVENRLTELWSILDFLNPGFLGNRNFFQKRFAAPIEKYGDRESLNVLRSLTQPFILRRLKTDKNIIQDLPEKQEMNVYCGLSVEQAELYQQLVDNSLEEIEDSDGIKRRGLILTLLLRLKQLCNHPKLLQNNQGKKVQIDPEYFSERSGKLLRLEEMLEEIVDEGDRALIFTQFSEWGRMLQPYLSEKLKGEVLFLYGATPRLARQEMVDRFQNEPNGPKIFILSLKAGGTGLNLTRANHVFHVDRWWNPAVENQATDRAFRIGQKRNVQVHKFVCTGTLEEKISDIIESKKELAEQTVNAGEQWLTDLDTNSLRSLLLLDRDAVIED